MEYILILISILFLVIILRPVVQVALLLTGLSREPVFYQNLIRRFFYTRLVLEDKPHFCIRMFTVNHIYQSCRRKGKIRDHKLFENILLTEIETLKESQSNYHISFKNKTVYAKKRTSGHDC